MAYPFIGEIRMFAGSFAPYGWNFCDGSLLSIAQFSPLFNLIGTTYGGDGQTNFKLPDLRSRVPVHQGNSTSGTYVIGQQGGVENVTLATAQLPSHTHTVQAVATGTTNVPASNTFPAGVASSQAGSLMYGPGTSSLTSLAPATISPTGGNQPHANIQPYTAITYIIALEGIYPSQN